MRLGAIRLRLISAERQSYWGNLQLTKLAPEGSESLSVALWRAGWNVTMVDINEAKLEAGRRDGIEVNGVKESNLRFTSFVEWTPADRAILLLCTKTYDNPAVLARIPLRHLLVPIQNHCHPTGRSFSTISEVNFSTVFDVCPW